MRYQCLDEKWTFRRGLLDSLAILQSDPGETVNLPHDGMIGTPVTPDAPAEADMGYFTGDLTIIRSMSGYRRNGKAAVSG